MTLSQNIRQWQADDVAGPLELKQVSLPAPGPGEVRIRVAACGLNFADTLMLEERYQEKPPWPLVLGMEVSGIVEAVGAGVTAPAVGSRVAAFAGHGGLSEAICLPAGACIALPKSVDMAAGAAFQVVYGTAHLALSRRAALRPGERLVVTGAAGGTGLATVQVGAAMGAEVVAIACGTEKLDLAKRAGAAHGIDASASDIRSRIKALGGADVVVDTVGAPLWDELLRAANPEARLFPIGFAGGEVPRIKANHLLVKNLSVLGFYWGGYLRFAPAALHQSLAHVLDWISTGKLEVQVSARYPFDQADKALAVIRRREARGKIVVTTEDSAGT